MGKRLIIRNLEDSVAFSWFKQVLLRNKLPTFSNKCDPFLYCKKKIIIFNFLMWKSNLTFLLKFWSKNCCKVIKQTLYLFFGHCVVFGDGWVQSAITPSEKRKKLTRCIYPMKFSCTNSASCWPCELGNLQRKQFARTQASSSRVKLISVDVPAVNLGKTLLCTSFNFSANFTIFGRSSTMSSFISN